MGESDYIANDENFRAINSFIHTNIENAEHNLLELVSNPSNPSNQDKQHQIIQGVALASMYRFDEVGLDILKKENNTGKSIKILSDLKAFTTLSPENEACCDLLISRLQAVTSKTLKDPENLPNPHVPDNTLALLIKQKIDLQVSTSILPDPLASTGKTMATPDTLSLDAKKTDTTATGEIVEAKKVDQGDVEPPPKTKEFAWKELDDKPRGANDL